MTEKEYLKLLDRIVKGAEYIENPLVSEEERQKAMRLYDALCQKVLEYRGMT